MGLITNAALQPRDGVALRSNVWLNFVFFELPDNACHCHTETRASTNVNRWQVQLSVVRFGSTTDVDRTVLSRISWWLLNGNMYFAGLSLKGLSTPGHVTR